MKKFYLFSDETQVWKLNRFLDRYWATKIHWGAVWPWVDTYESLIPRRSARCRQSPDWAFKPSPAERKEVERL